MAAYFQEVRKLEDKFQGIEQHHVPQKDNDATNFLVKLATMRIPSLDEMHPDVDPALKGSDPSVSVMTMPADVAMVTLDQANWRAPLLAYLLEEVIPPKRIEA
ncbi:uncharacterized protein [Miscanthus floridulus]|uniref:uncharacterized protein n=1 Tax=Miscanthus floridulus TaxID=154761 RepID=UPI0034597CEC